MHEYINKFSNLRRDHAQKWPTFTLNLAPHKPILLLAILDLFSQDKISQNLIKPSKELSEIFLTYWSNLKFDHKTGIHLPFYSLKNDGFWKLISVQGREEFIAKRPRSENELRENFSGATLPSNLFSILNKKGPRQLLREVILANYFSHKAIANLSKCSSLPSEQEFLFSEELSAASGQGFNSSSADRIAIENHAVKEAIKYFEAEGYSIKEVGKPYDLHCVRGKETLYVEVKGTQGQGDRILLTRNEVKFAELRYPDTALFILKKIKLEKSKEGINVTGGETSVIQPWQTKTENLLPLSYEYLIEIE